MTSKITVFVSVVMLMGIPAITVAADSADLKTDQQKNGYSVGYDIGRSVKRQIVDMDSDAMARGLKDGLNGAASAVPEAELQQRFATVRQESAQKIMAKNKQEGEAFLAKNKGAKGVKTTASGLQYKVLTAGKGKQPKPEDTVTVNYRGTLIDGTEFDSTYKRNQPSTFPVKGVIAGWTEALPLMKEGAKWMLYIPSNLGYAERAAANNMIGPNSTLIFEVELLSIKQP